MQGGETMNTDGLVESEKKRNHRKDKRKEKKDKRKGEEEGKKGRFAPY
jgi:hypothetical protein